MAETFSHYASVETYRDDEVEQAVARVEMLAQLMDSVVTIPGTNVRVGLDAALGLVPVVGDLLSQAVASYIIWEARRLGVSRLTLARMIGNSALDTLVGMVPFAGDAFDVMYRANRKNLALLGSTSTSVGTPRRRAGPGRSSRAAPRGLAEADEERPMRALLWLGSVAAFAIWSLFAWIAYGLVEVVFALFGTSMAALLGVGQAG